MARSRAAPEIPGWDHELFKRAEKRVEKLDSQTLYLFCENTGSEVFKLFSDHRNHGELEPLDEIRVALIQLFAVMEELRLRSEAFHDPH